MGRRAKPATLEKMFTALIAVSAIACAIIIGMTATISHPNPTIPVILLQVVSIACVLGVGLICVRIGMAIDTLREEIERKQR